MNPLVRKLRYLLVNKYSFYIYPTISIISTLALIYCLLSPNCGGVTRHARNTNDVTEKNQRTLHCYLFLLFLSSPKGSLERKAIRETWLGPKYYKHKVEKRFVVGTKNLSTAKLRSLQLEDAEHKDLLFLPDFIDSYQGLTRKLLKAFNWVSSHVDTKFVMKLDEDSFVRLDVLLNDLEKKEHLGRLYWGFFNGNAHVKKKGPWAEHSWYLSDNYLPYALGGGYVLSGELVHHISSTSHMLQTYNSEDVSVGAWLAPVALNRIHDVRFDTEYKSRGCLNTDVVSHKQSTDEMYAKHEQLIRNNTLCRKEVVLTSAYEYDWSQPPSKCCKRFPRKSG